MRYCLNNRIYGLTEYVYPGRFHDGFVKSVMAGRALPGAKPAAFILFYFDVFAALAYSNPQDFMLY